MNRRDSASAIARPSLVLFSHAAQRHEVERLLRSRSPLSGASHILVVPETCGTARRWDVQSTLLTDALVGRTGAVEELGRTARAAWEDLVRRLDNQDRAADCCEGVSVWGSVMPEISHRFVQPLLQTIWAFDRILQELRPCEVMVPSSASWRYSGAVFEGTGPAWINYSNLIPILLARVANQRGIPVRSFRSSSREACLYLIRRFLRQGVFATYRFVHWMSKPDRAGSCRSFRARRDRHSIAVLLRSRAGAKRLAFLAESTHANDVIWLQDRPLAGPAEGSPPSERDVPLAGRFAFLKAEAATVLHRVRIRRMLRLLDTTADWLEGVYYGDLLRAVLRSYVCETVEVRAYSRAAKQVLQRMSPRVWIVANDQSVAGQVSVRSATLHGVPTVLVQHGVISDPPVKKPITSHVAVPTPRDRDLLSRWGVPDKRISVLGLEGYGLDRGRIERTDLAIRLDEQSSRGARPAVSILSSRIPNRHTLTRIAASLSTDEELVIYLKIHPTESRKEYERVLQLSPRSRVHVVDGMGIRDILSITDILISYESTAVVEAMIQEIPVLVVPLGFRPGIVEHPIYREHPGLRQASEITEALIHSLRPGGSAREAFVARQNEYLSRWLPSEGEGGSDQLLQTIDTLLASGRYGRGEHRSSGKRTGGT